MMRPLLAALLALFLISASAEEKTTPPLNLGQKQPPLINPISQGITEAPALSKVEWLKKNKALLPASFCKQKSLIRNCFLIDDKQCEDFSKTISESCFNGVEKRLPDSLTGLDQKYYGKLVKACAYDLFEKLLIDKRVPHPECRSLGEKVVPKQKASSDPKGKLPGDPLPPKPPITPSPLPPHHNGTEKK